MQDDAYVSVTLVFGLDNDSIIPSNLASSCEMIVYIMITMKYIVYLYIFLIIPDTPSSPGPSHSPTHEPSSTTGNDACYWNFDNAKTVDRMYSDHCMNAHVQRGVIATPECILYTIIV